MPMVMFMAKKTTILLRDDVYQVLKEKAGAKNISNLINQIIIEYFAKEGSMLGAMKKVDTSDLRNHRDHM
jgi:predicted CopG family antitoxin